MSLTTSLIARAAAPPLPSRYPAVLMDRLMYATRGSTDRLMNYRVRFDGRLDEARMRRALRLLVDAEPIFGCVFVVKGRRAYWHRRVDLDTMTLCPCIETEDVEAALKSFTTATFDAANDLPLRAQILRTESGDMLAFKVNHLAADAVGGRELLYLLAAIYRRLSDDADYRPTPNLRGERGLTQLFRQPHVLKRALQIRRSKQQAQFGPGFPANGNPNPTERQFLYRHVEPEAFLTARAYGKARGATVNDLMLTAVFRALFQTIPAEAGTPYVIQAPEDLRAQLPGGRTGAICNMARTLPARLAPLAGESFEATLRRVSEVMQAARARPPSLLPWVRLAGGFTLLGMEGMHARLGAVNSHSSRSISLSNYGRLDPAQLDFGQPTAIEAVAHGSIHRPPGLMLTFSSFRDRLTLTSGFFADAVDPAAMSDFLDRVHAELTGDPATA